MKRILSLVLVCSMILSSVPAFAEQGTENEKGFFGKAWDSVSGAASTAWDATTGAVENAWDATADFAETAWDATTNAAEVAWDATTGAVETAWDATTGAVETAWDWTQGAATDAWNWTADAATSAWIWTTGAVNDAWNWTTQAAVDVADWTSKAATDAWHWTTGAATDAWNWTQNAANDAWTWTCETAIYTWTATSKAVSGTWDNIFGELTGVGPHHLCISSPLFKSTELIGEWTDNDGTYMECFIHNSDYEITLIATSRDEETLPPSVGEMDFANFVALNFDSATFAQDVASGAGVRAMAQELRFKAIDDGLPVYGRALGVWTDHYIVCFIITSFVPVSASDNTIDETSLIEIDELYDLWLETLSIYETRKYDFETAHINETANAGTLTPSKVMTANRIFDEERFHALNGGHGWAAERANNMIDNIQGIFKGYRSKITGDDNLANGSDRLLTTINGASYQIQSKYYETAYASIYACFDDDWKFRYWDSNDKPMQIEVPSDQYDKAIEYMRRFISEGKLTHVTEDGRVITITDPDEAVNIVKKGHITYKQAKHIAHAGNIYSLTYDAVNGCVDCASSIGISAVVEFAVGMWSGDDINTALKKSIYTGLEVGGSSFIISVLSSQLSKTGLNSLLVGSSEAVVKLMGPKAAATFVNAFRHGNKIYGAAAMKSAAKLLRGNFITDTVSMIVVSVPDVVDTFRGRISGKQLLKNLATTGGGIIGGSGGWFGGAALGSMIFPGVGTVIGGILGSVTGGFVVQVATDTVADMIVADDADEMLDIVSEEFKILATEYLISETDAEAVATELNNMITADALKDMFASSARNMYAREIFLRPIMESVIAERVDIELPTAEEYQDVLIDVMESIYDEIEEEVMVP